MESVCSAFILTASCFLLPSRGEEGADLHADGLERVPAALPVHPHHAVVRAVLGHLLGVGSAHVVAAVGIGRVAAVVPPASSVLPGTLLGVVPGGPGDRRLELALAD